jgi:Heparinase II/III-like protein
MGATVDVIAGETPSLLTQPVGAVTTFPKATERPWLIPGGVAALREKSNKPQLKSHVDALFRAANSYLETKADGTLAQPLMTRVSGQGLNEARELLTRVHSLGLATIISGDPKYCGRLWRDIERVSDATLFPNWTDPGQELAIGEFAHATGLAFDWCNRSWTPTQYNTLKAAMLRNAIVPAAAFYQTPVKWWSIPSKKSNWNLVVNGGLLVATVSLGGHGNVNSPQGTLYKIVLASLKRGLTLFSGDGSAPEGGGYWIYALEYLSQATDAVIGATGSHQGILDDAGLRATGDFTLAICSNAGRPFNYADSNGIGRVPFMWLGSRYNLPHLRAFGVTAASKRVTASAYYLLAYTDEGDATSLRNRTTTAYRFEGTQIVSLRTNWQDINSIFAAFKGGDNQQPHTHLDLGAFQLEAQNFVWFTDLGIGDYRLPGYFNSRDKEDSPAYDYYRIRAEGHNTLLLNPGDGPDQNIFAKAAVNRFRADANMASLNLSEAYASEAGTVERGMAIVENGKAVIIQDRIGLSKRQVQYTWTAHTTVTSARFLDSTRRSLVLENSKGQRLLVYVIQPGRSFVPAADGTPLHPALPLPTSPNPPGQPSDAAFRKLMLSGATSTFLITTVVMLPLGPTDAEVIPQLSDARITSDIQNWGF